MKLSNNRELYEYLLLLDSQLKDRGEGALSKHVAMAARTASAFPATEFFGESRIALRHVLTEENSILSQIERADLLDVLK